VKSLMLTEMADAGPASNKAPTTGRNFRSMWKTFVCGGRNPVACGR
jgi:hypothetical protein